MATVLQKKWLKVIINIGIYLYQGTDKDKEISEYEYGMCEINLVHTKDECKLYDG